MVDLIRTCFFESHLDSYTSPTNRNSFADRYSDITSIWGTSGESYASVVISGILLKVFLFS